MLKIVKFDGTQLSNKPALLSEVAEEGLLFVNDDGEEELLSFETIKEYFLNKIVKVKFEEVSRNILE